MDDLLNALSEPTVIIKKERYQELLDAEDELNSLNAGGVDNWIGYGECFEEGSDD